MAVFYNEFTAYAGIEGVSKEAAKAAAKTNQNVLQKIMGTLGEIFALLIPALICGGLVLGFRNVIGEINFFNNGTQSLADISQFWSGMYNFLWLIGEAVFHLLPVGIVWSITKKMGTIQILRDKGMSPSDALRIVQVHSRDNGRTPMQWNASKYAGFTVEDGQEPWIGINGNYVRINAEEQLEDETSIFHYYQTLIGLRKELDVIAYGSIEPLAERDPSVFAYRRHWEGQELIVTANFYGKEYEWKKAPELEGFKCVLGNYPDTKMPENGVLTLRPYEVSVWYRSRE